MAEDSEIDPQDQQAAPMLFTIKSNRGLPVATAWLRSWRRLLGGAAATLAIAVTLVLLRWRAHRTRTAQELRPSVPSKAVQLDGGLYGGYFHSPGDCSYLLQTECPAETLFHSLEVYEVATENILRAGRGGILGPDDRHLVRAMVGTGLKNISKEIAMRAPTVAAELASIRLSERQKDSVLAALRLLGDPRVQFIGHAVGRAIHSAGCSSRQCLLSKIRAELRPHVEDIRELHDEVLVTQLGQSHLLASWNPWEMTLDEDNVRAMGPYYYGKFASLHTSQDVVGAGPLRPMPFIKKSYGVMGGVLEEGRALLHLIKLYGRLAGRELDVPTYVTALGGNLQLSPQELNCEHHFHKLIEIKLMKVLFCPLKFGTQGLDAIRAASEFEKERRLQV